MPLKEAVLSYTDLRGNSMAFCLLQYLSCCYLEAPQMWGSCMLAFLNHSEMKNTVVILTIAMHGAVQNGNMYVRIRFEWTIKLTKQGKGQFL